MSAAITGWGMAVPARVVTNEELAQAVEGIDEEWIVRRTGIRERRIAGPGETTSTLSTAAGAQALARAGVSADQLDAVILATCTPDRPIPATAPLIQHALGASRAAAFDLNAACAGFLTAFATADGLIAAGRADSVLVIGAEVLSRFVDWEDRKTCVLFGDGAGAVVLQRSDQPAGLVSVAMGASGEAAGLIQVTAGGSAVPPSAATIAAGEHLIRMNGPEVYRAAVRIMSEAAAEALARSGVGASDIGLFIAHQANDRIIEDVRSRLDLTPAQTFSNVARYGNTSAASIPIALCEAANEGRLWPGAPLLLSAVGAGLAWAGALAIWTEATTGVEEKEPDMAGARA